MTVSLQNLRAVGVGVEPSSLLPGQIAFNVTDKVIYVGDGSSLKTNFDGTTTGGSPGGGWFAMPMDYSFLNTYFLTNPELYGDFPTDGQVVTWSTPLSRPIWTSNGGGGGSNQVYQTTNAAVASATGATLSDRISAAIGVVSPDEGNVTIVTGLPGDVYQGLYFFFTSWVRGAYFAYPTASNVPYSNLLSGLSAITVQQAIDEVDGLVNIAQSTANTAAADAAAAQVVANAALPKAGGTMTGAISFVAGQVFPVSGIQDSTLLQKGVVQGGSNMIYTSPGVMDVRAASVSQSGVVTLSDSTSLTSSTVAATSTAAKNLQDQIDAISLASNVFLAGTLDAASGLVTSVTTDGTIAGFVSGLPLPAPAVGNADYYVIVDNDGSYNPPGGGGPYAAEVGDWFLSDGTSWQFLGVGNRPAYATTSSAGIIQLSDNSATQAGLNALLAVTPASLQSKVSDSISLNSSTFVASSAAVKTAYDRGATAETNSIPKITVAAKGTIVTGSAANTPAGLPVGTNNQILIVNSATATGLQWAGDITGFVTGVSGTAPITINNLNPQTPIVGISAASTLVSGAVQLEDSTTSTSTSLALTANQGYSLQQQINALTVSNNLTLAGTIDGSTGLMVTVTAEGTLQGFTVGAAMPTPVAGNSEYFTIVTVPGTMTPPGGSAQAVNDGDWWLSNGTTWQYLPIGYSAPYATTTSSGVVQLATDAEVQAGVETTHAVVPSSLQSKLSDSTSTTSSTTIASSTAVKNAYDLANAAVPKACYTALGALAAGTGASTVGTLALGTNGQFLAANSGAGTGLEWCTLSLACVPCSAFTASGQLLAGTGTSTFTALNVGSNNQILVADSACTGGLKWLTSQGAFLCGYTCSASPFNTVLGSTAGAALTNLSVANTAIGYAALKTETTGDFNVALGHNALTIQNGASGNVAIGGNSGAQVTTGSNNTLIGCNAGDLITTASCNTAVGFNALGAAATAAGTVAIGANTLTALTSGAGNTTVGFNSGVAITTGANNTILGFNAGDTISTGTQNTFVGACSGGTLAGTSEGNTGIGFSALGQGVTSGAYNVAVGNSAGLNVSSGALNTLVGYTAGSSITTGGSNTLIGRYTGTATLSNNIVLSDGAGTIRFQANSNGAWSYDGTNFGTVGQFLASNGTVAAPSWCTLSLACVPCAAFVACGDLLVGTGSATFTALPTGTNGQSLVVDTTCTATGGLKWGSVLQGYTCGSATFNTAIGCQAGDSITSGTDNVTIGYNAGTAITTGSQNVVIGSNTSVSSNAVGIVAVGFCAGQAVTTGGCVTHIGWVSGRNSTGASNTYVGALTGCAASNTSACGTLLGFCAGAALTAGNANTFLGFNSGRSTTTGTFNVAVGAASFQSGTGSCNIAIGCGALSGSSSGAANVAIGHRAMLNTSSGVNNVAIGLESGVQISSGSNNTFVGTCTGDTVTTGTQNTFIGSGSGGAVATNSEANTAVGFGAGGTGTLAGGYNTVLGHSAGQAITAGGGNTFVGYQSGASVTTGIHNTFLGRYLGTAAMSNNVVLADGASNIKLQINENGAVGVGTTPSYGTAGQVLKSAGTAAAPAWSSAIYGAFSSSVSQLNADTTNGNVITVNTTSSANGVSIGSSSQITVSTTGVYNIQISLQIEKTDAGTDSVEVWFKKNGTNIANSNTNIELSGNGAKQLFSLNLVESMTAGQYLEVWWYSADVNVQLTAAAAGTRPAIPSAIVTLVPVGA